MYWGPEKLDLSSLVLGPTCSKIQPPSFAKWRVEAAMVIFPKPEKCPVSYDVGDRRQTGWYNMKARMSEVPGHMDSMQTVEQNANTHACWIKFGTYEHEMAHS